MDMNGYKFASLTDKEETRIEQLENELGCTLIAYEKEDTRSPQQQ